MKVCRMFKLSDYFAPQQINRDTYFKNLCSAKVSMLTDCLCYAVSLEYLNIALKNPCISAIITNSDLLSLVKTTEKAIIVAEEAELSYLQLKNKLIEQGYLLPEIEYNIDSSARIHPSADIGHRCRIGKNVIIGKNSLIKDYTIINDNCIIGDNCTIGNEGLYFKRDKNGILHKILHSGGVFLGKNVEIMNNSMVQRSHDSAQPTAINEGTKISINVNIAHSTQIGTHTLVSGNVQIAGRVRIGDFCFIGTSSTISDSIAIGDHAQVKIGSIVVKDVKPGQEVSGNFAYEHAKQVRNFIKNQQ